MKPSTEQSEGALRGADWGLQGLLARLKHRIKAVHSSLRNPARHKLYVPTPRSQDVVSPLMKQDSQPLLQNPPICFGCQKAVRTD